MTQSSPPSGLDASLSGLGEGVMRLILDSAKGNADLLRRTAEVTRTVQQRPKANPQDLAELVNRAVTVNLEYYAMLTAYGQRFLADVLGIAERALSDPAKAPAAPTAAPTSPLAVANLRAVGRIGETATVAFIIENRLIKATALSFSVGDFEPDNGELVKSDNVVFDPARPVLEPQAEQLVHAPIPVQPPFVAGQEYRTYIQVNGDQPYRLNLVLRVEEAAGEPAPRKKRVVATRRTAGVSKVNDAEQQNHRS